MHYRWFDGRRGCLKNVEASMKGEDVIARISSREGVPIDDIFVTRRSRVVNKDDVFQLRNDVCDFQVHLRVLGGKGGFGAMLRGMGAGGKKTTDFSAMRDLNGRRLRHVENEEKLAAYLAEQEANKGKEKEKVKKELPAHVIRAQKKAEEEASNAIKIAREQVDNVECAVSEGLSAAKDLEKEKSRKRALESEARKKKMKKMKIAGLDLSSDDDSDESGDGNIQPVVKK